MENRNDTEWYKAVCNLAIGSPSLLLCEREDIHIVPFVDEETSSYAKYQLPIRKDLMLVKGVVPKTPRPLVGMDWLQTITEIVESTLRTIMLDKDNDLYTDWKNSLSGCGDTFLIGSLYGGPSGMYINTARRLSLESSRSDTVIGEKMAEGCSPEALTKNSVLIAAIGLIGYWQRQGVELHCPLAKLFAVLMDIGFFSMIPMFNLTDLEKARPVWKECLEDYGNTGNHLIDLLECFIFMSNEMLSPGEEKRVSSSAGLLFAILKEELARYQELHNESEEGHNEAKSLENLFG